MRALRVLIVAASCVVGLGQTASAQTAIPDPAAEEGWKISTYPVLVWVPLGISVDVDTPPVNGDAGGSGRILDSQLDGAFFGGATASNGVWRVDGYGIWAGFGGDRIEQPALTVDMDLIYGIARLGHRIAPDLFINAGVRRFALKYDIRLGNLPQFSRKPGLWDPLVGIGWHHEGRKVEWHATFDGGGFGVGADVDLGAELRLDWKPVRHFGFTLGYNALYLKLSDDVAGRTLNLKATLHGPAVGIGLYF